LSRSGSTIERLSGKLIVSCQDYVESMVAAAVRGGAAGLRVNSPRYVRLARAMTELPIIGCNKIFFPNTEICITPSTRAAMALVRAGADIVALDCTTRRRPRQSAAQMIAAIHDAGALALADLSSIEDGLRAVEEGADLLATTLAPDFDPELIHSLARLGRPVLAEGHITSPERAKEAIAAGAWAVCVGTAITRPHWITEQFNKAIGG